ncbi:MAG TPA: hypothetical protein VFP57_02925 [Sphingomicrobium sp.]|jgi:hypothetical protein|nr:hypothetical protein [Sphingomicrobium sp.]
MKRLLILPLLLGLIAASPPSPTVEVATGNWSNLPKLKRASYDHLSAAVMMKLYQIVREHKCALPGQKGIRMDITFSFATQFDGQGKLQRLILPALNCPEAESWLGGTLLQAIQAGDYVPSGANDSGWYRGELSFEYDG